MDWRCLYPAPVPGIHLSVLSPLGLPASDDLIVLTKLYHTLLEVSEYSALLLTIN